MTDQNFVSTKQVVIDMDKYATLPDLLTAQEAASILRCTARNIAYKCERGEWRAFKAGKGWRVNRDDVLRYARLI